MISRTLLFTMVASAAICFGAVSADTVTVDLEYRTDTLGWELYALVNDTGEGNDGDNGLASVRALIDNIEFGTNGDAITIASGIGALGPPFALETSGGTIDVTYLQDISDANSVVGGVGVVTRDLIMHGTFPAAGTPPAFGDADNGTTTDGDFLDVAVPGPFGSALPWDGVTLNVVDVTPGGGVAGDYNGNGTVDAADYNLWLAQLGSAGGTFSADGTGDDLQGVPDGKVDLFDYQFWKQEFGNSGAAGSHSRIPEPTGIALLVVAVVAVAGRRSYRDVG